MSEPGGGGEFREAVRDYRWLLDRGYAPKSAGILVGDRRRLSAEERLILFRGVAGGRDSARRRERASRARPGDRLLLDAYNVAFTLVHYFLGKPCFRSTDGFLRDAGANYGRLPREELLDRAFGELAGYLAGLQPGSLEAWLDAPVSRSAAHAALLRERLREAGFGTAGGPAASVALARSADGAIEGRCRELAAEAEALAAGGTAETGESFGSGPCPRRPGEEGLASEGTDLRPLVLSSDSVLIERAPRAFDAARAFLEERYSPDFLDLAPLAAD